MTTLVRPANPKTETIAHVHIYDGVLAVVFAEKRDDFRQAIKGLGYRWEWRYHQWQRTPHKLAGELADRLAETGRVLLAAGFVVEFPDETIAQAAVEGSYTPEVTRWILAYQGEFRIWWLYSRDQDWYPLAHRLAGAHWNKDAHMLLVPAEHYAEVMDFAQIHGFGISEEAQQLADEAARVKADAWTVDITDVPAWDPNANRPTLEAQEEGVDDSLRDEPL